VEGNWPDKKGTTSGHPFTKKFVAVFPDTVSPSPDKWKLTIPAKATRIPLHIDTGEPLDYFLLINTISILDASGQTINGSILISNNESMYSFTPEMPWTAGEYTIMVEQRLADLAGNNLDRLFDVDLYNTKEQKQGKPGNKITWKIN
jgi:hypothetical protein